MVISETWRILLHCLWLRSCCGRFEAIQGNISRHVVTITKQILFLKLFGKFTANQTEKSSFPTASEDFALSLIPALLTFVLLILKPFHLTVINFDLLHSLKQLVFKPEIFRYATTYDLFLGETSACIPFYYAWHWPLLHWKKNNDCPTQDNLFPVFSIHHFPSLQAWGEPSPFSFYKNSEVWSIHGSLTFTFIPVSFCSPL